MDDSFCTDIFLSNLIAFAPTNDDDLKTMEIYMKKSPEECDELDVPEQLTIEVKRMTNITWKRDHRGSSNNVCLPALLPIR